MEPTQIQETVQQLKAEKAQKELSQEQKEALKKAEELRKNQQAQAAYLKNHQMNKAIEPKLPVVTCTGKNQAMIACCNPECKETAFICYNKQCQCQKPHKRCKYLKLQLIIDTLVHSKMNIPKEDVLSFASIFDIIDQMIEQLSIIRDQLYIARDDFGLKKYQGLFFNSIQKSAFGNVNGDIMDNVDEEIRNGQKPSIISACNIKAMWEVYNVNFKRICAELRNCFDREGTAKIKASEKSKITQEFLQLEKWIEPSIGTPIKQFKLLFRASQNNFSATQFHQKCDGIANTLVLVQTQFGKTIGGFTNKAWNQSGSYQTNQDSKTFIFSLNTKQKMTCVNTSYSIYGNSGYGPTFGGGHDLYICDGAHNSNSSYFNFPHSFNLANKTYTNNQYSYAVFAGPTIGYNSKIKQYEVYQIL